MRILMIATEKLPVPPVRGGAIQTYIAGIAGPLARHHDLTILGRNDPELPDDERVDGIRFVRVPGGVLDVYTEGVKQHLQSHSYDLIHIYNRPLLVGPVREAAPHARLILSMHNDMFFPEKIPPEQAVHAIEQVERIVTVSDYIGNTIKGLYPQAEGKTRTIYSGVDLPRYRMNAEAERVRSALRAEHGLQGKKVILFVGRLSPKKGADILVRSMYFLAKKHPDAALVLVGSRWYSDDGISDYIAYVRALAARCPIPVVTTGFVSPADVHKWFWAGDLFVCPSQWQEPLARVHYEAMAAGLPIITTDRGGNPEVIEENRNGLVIREPENPLEFADKISTLLSGSGRLKEMGAHGRTLAERHYGWERVISDVLDVWGT